MLDNVWFVSIVNSNERNMLVLSLSVSPSLSCSSSLLRIHSDCKSWVSVSARWSCLPRWAMALTATWERVASYVHAVHTFSDVFTGCEFFSWYTFISMRLSELGCWGQTQWWWLENSASWRVMIDALVDGLLGYKGIRLYPLSFLF